MKISVASEGQSFAEPGLSIEWPRGGGRRGVADVPDDQATWSRRLAREFKRGRLVAVDAVKAPTKAPAVRKARPARSGS